MPAHHLLALSAATALFVTVSQAGLGQELKNKPLAVTTPDGLSISAQEWGNPNGPGIVFIHGFSQSNLSWMRQTHSDLAKEFHIVTYDLRGHGCARVSGGGPWNRAASVPSGVRYKAQRPRVCLRDPAAQR